MLGVAVRLIHRLIYKPKKILVVVKFCVCVMLNVLVSMSSPVVSDRSGLPKILSLVAWVAYDYEVFTTKLQQQQNCQNDNEFFVVVAVSLMMSHY